MLRNIRLKVSRTKNVKAKFLVLFYKEGNSGEDIWDYRYFWFIG